MKDPATAVTVRGYDQLEEGADVDDYNARAVERMMRRIVIDTNGCWLFQAPLNRDGYGHFGMRGRVLGAHRVAYELFVGPISPGLEIDHLCKVRHCLNPAHLEAVTKNENRLRSNAQSVVNAAKTHCKRGHEFTPDNITWTEKGGRRCKACTKVRHREYQRARQATLRAGRNPN